MIDKEYVDSFQKFVNIEIELISIHSTKEILEIFKPYYLEMNTLISKSPNDFEILNQQSTVSYFELEFIEAVDKIKEILLKKADERNIPRELLFIPRIQIRENFWDQFVYIKTANLVREIFDTEKGYDFETLKKFKHFDRHSPIVSWIKSKNGLNFLFELQIIEGIKAESLVRKILYLFDNEFVRQQKLRMSTKIWIHNVIIEAYQKWNLDKSLWTEINQLKRKIKKGEQKDESRLEIKFLRKLENAGLKGKFIHDESISWQIKYRPDFWFIQDDLIVEYDEKAHERNIESDLNREKIIKKYLPRIKFIRVFEGFEEKGLKEILTFLSYEPK